jgi:hypothetical protein
MTETKQWMGLHNHDRHFYSPGYGDRCGKCWYCSPETPCYCCLQAEVEALRARNETLIATIQRQDSTFERQMEEHEELEALRAQVQRVREEVNGDQPIPRASDDLDNVAAYCAGYVDALRRVRRALDGDNDA